MSRTALQKQYPPDKKELLPFQKRSILAVSSARIFMGDGSDFTESQETDQQKLILFHVFLRENLDIRVWDGTFFSSARLHLKNRKEKLLIVSKFLSTKSAGVLGRNLLTANAPLPGMGAEVDLEVRTNRTRFPGGGQRLEIWVLKTSQGVRLSRLWSPRIELLKSQMIETALGWKNDKLLIDETP